MCFVARLEARGGADCRRVQRLQLDVLHVALDLLDRFSQRLVCRFGQQKSYKRRRNEAEARERH